MSDNPFTSSTNQRPERPSTPGTDRRMDPDRDYRPDRRGRIPRSRPAPDPDLLDYLATGEVTVGRERESSASHLPVWTPVTPEPSRTPASVRVQEPVQRPSIPLFPAGNTDIAPAESIPAILKRRAGTILAFTLLGWALVAAYVTFVAPIFESSTTLLVDTRGFRDEVEDLPRMSAESSTFGAQKIANHALLLESSLELADATATRLMNARSAGTFTGQFTLFEDAPETELKTTVVRRLREDYVTILPQPSDDDEPDAITISVRSTDKQEAAFIANTFAREYINSVESAINRHFSEARTYYSERLDEQSAVLGTLDTRMEAFVRTDGSVIFEEEATQLIRQIAALRSDLDDARVAIRQHEAQLESYDKELSEMAPQLKAERVATGLQEEIDQTNSRIAELELEAERFYTRNPDLRANPAASADLVKILEEASSLRLRAEDLSVQYVDEIVSVGGVDLRSHNGSISYMAQLRRSLAEERIALSGARARENALEARLGEYEQRRRAMPAQSVDLKQLQREHDEAYTAYTDLEAKLRSVRDAESSRRMFAQIITPALPSREPVRSPLTIGLLGCVLTVMLSLGAGYGLDRVDSRIHSDIQLQALGHSAASFIPSLPSGFMNLFRTTSRKPFGERRVAAEIHSLVDASTPMARAIRRLQLRLQDSQTIVVTSAESGAGKSTLATNLAVASAQSGRRTVLIDADVYHPSVIRLLGLGDQAEFDLASCTFTDGRHVESFSDMLPNLYAVALTGPADGTSEFLLSTHFIPFLERLRNSFDVIIMDAPPALVSSDALRLAQHADTTIMVVRAGQSRGESVESTISDIRDANGSGATVVMTAFEPARLRVPQYGGSKA